MVVGLHGIYDLMLVCVRKWDIVPKIAISIYCNLIMGKINKPFDLEVLFRQAGVHITWIFV